VIHDVAIASLFGLSLSGGIASEEPEARTFVGRVVDERRFPVAGASVTVLGPKNAKRLVATTGADGGFRIELRVTEADVEPADDGLWPLFTFLATTPDRRVGSATERLLLNDEARRETPLREAIVVAPGGRLVAEVRDGEGPVPGATLELRGSHGAWTIVSALSDPDGHAVLDPAPIGDFALFVKKAGRGRATVAAKVEALKTFEARVELRKLRTLAVDVVDAESGEPIPGASVSVVRVKDSSDPRGRASLQRYEDFVAEPRRSDARGHFELRDLEAESVLWLTPRAPHYVEIAADPSIPPGLGGRTSSRIDRPWQQVSADAGSIRIEMARPRIQTLRWKIVPGSAPTPPDGTALNLEWVDNSGPHRRQAPDAWRAVVRDGTIEIDCEMQASHGVQDCFSKASATGWAVSPDGSIAELAPPRGSGDGTASFAPSATLTVKLRAPDGTPPANELVSVLLESFDHGNATPMGKWRWTDGSGGVSIAALRAGRWTVVAGGNERVVELAGLDKSVDFEVPPTAEVVVAFTVDGERRLPARFWLSIDGEDLSRRREDPERGEIHLFVMRPSPGRELQINFGSPDWEAIRRSIVQPPGPDPLVVPLPLRKRGSCDAIARVRGFGRFNTFILLERQDEASGRFLRPKPDVFFQPESRENPHEQRLNGLQPGTWRLAYPELGLCGAPGLVVDGGPPAELELDLSGLTQIGVAWKVPAAENGAFLELETVGPRYPFEHRRANEEEEEWPLGRGERGTDRFVVDPKQPPRLIVRHPYLVGSTWNDAIDLRNPRTTITLHVEPGPLFCFTPAFERDAPFVYGAFVTLAGNGDASESPEVRKALRRGEGFAMAPPAAGRYRVLIDPVVAAPVELDDLAFDGGPRDLGPIRFPPGTTLHVHARATAPFAPPRLAARATRLDGLAYQRASSTRRSLEAPCDPEIGALGPGRFRVTLEIVGRAGGRTWTEEVEVDGVHDAELEVVTD
jgi:hypothetical protein